MAGVLTGGQMLGEELDKHRRIIWALIMRESATRYGRDNLGFLWVIAEPLFFAIGVSIMWSLIKGPVEHGMRVVPFVITGYMPLVLFRNTIGHVLHAFSANSGLLYHRQITPLHLYIGRFCMEAIGATCGFALIVMVLLLLGLMDPPKNLMDVGLIFVGWFLLAWITFGLAMIMAALAQLFEFVERIAQIITYLMLPLSGTFYMASWLPAKGRDAILHLPFLHCWEIIRSGFFGEFITVYYNVPYVIAWAVGFTLLGLILLQFVRGSVEVE